MGDADLDGTVNGDDFAAWNGAKFTTSLLWSDGNFNGDGFVDGKDLLEWNANKFTTIPPATVPEPAALLLLMMVTVFGCRSLRS